MISSNPKSTSPTPMGICGAPDFIFGEKKCMCDFVSDVKCIRILNKLIKIDTKWHAQGLSKKHPTRL